jgi:hypothetical protein
MSEEIDKPKNLEFYLSDHSFNTQLHESFERVGFSKPVAVFEVFYDLLRLIKSGQTLAAIDKIQVFKSDGLAFYFVYYLRERLRDDEHEAAPTDNALNAALHLLDKEYERLEKLLQPDPIPFAITSESLVERAIGEVSLHEFSKKFVNDMVDKMMKEAEEKQNIVLRAKQEERERLEREFLPRIQEAVAAATNKSKKNPEFTTNRQVLALGYMLKHLGVKNVDKTVQANFIEFLTDKNNKDIYDRVRSFDTTIYNKGGEDARYVKDWFEKLGLTEIVKEIDMMLDKKSEKL